MAAAVVNHTAYVDASSGTTHNGNLTVSAGTNRKIILIVLAETSAAPVTGTPTVDGNNFSSILSGSNSGDTAQKAWAYYYDWADGAGTGSKAVNVSTSPNSTGDLSWFAYQLEGVATGAPEYSHLTESNNSVTTCSDTGITVSAGAVLIAAASSGSGTPTVSWNATVTERTENNETNHTTACADDVQASAGTKTVTATWTSSAGFKLLCALSIAAAASATPRRIRPATMLRAQAATVAGTGTVT